MNKILVVVVIFLGFFNLMAISEEFSKEEIIRMKLKSCHLTYKSSKDLRPNVLQNFNLGLNEYNRMKRKKQENQCRILNTIDYTLESSISFVLDDLNHVGSINNLECDKYENKEYIALEETKKLANLFFNKFKKLEKLENTVNLMKENCQAKNFKMNDIDFESVQKLYHVDNIESINFIKNINKPISVINNVNKKISIVDINNKTYTASFHGEGFQIKGLEGKMMLLLFFGHKLPPKDLSSVDMLNKLHKKYKKLINVVAIETQRLNTSKLKIFSKNHNINYMMISGLSSKEFVDYMVSQMGYERSIPLPLLIIVNSNGSVESISTDGISETKLEQMFREKILGK